MSQSEILHRQSTELFLTESALCWETAESVTKFCSLPKALSTLSQKSATVADNGEIRRLSHFFCDSVDRL